ncbi:hypothetical protein BGZ92_005182, partial [Podila epicladia]
MKQQARTSSEGKSLHVARSPNHERSSSSAHSPSQVQARKQLAREAERRADNVRRFEAKQRAAERHRLLLERRREARMHNISPPPDNELDAHLDMERSATLEQIFAEQGLLARSIPGYRVRASQMKMARAVAATMQHAQMLHQLYEQDPDKKLAASRTSTKNASAAKKVPNAATEQPPLSTELSACTLLAEAGTGT